VIETRQVDPRIRIKQKLSLNELIFLTQLFLSENNKTETDEFDRLLESKINQKRKCSVFEGDVRKLDLEVLPFNEFPFEESCNG
jgi:hypothetical protein